MSDRTLVLLKPDTVERKLIGEVISRFERKNLTVVAMDLRTLDADTLARHYEEHVGKGFYAVKIHHGFFETPDVPRALEDARRFGLALDVDTATFFIGRETLVPAERSELGRWRNRLYRAMASAALSPARFYHLPTNRVVELGTQITI